LKEDASERSRRYVEITSASLSRLKLMKPLASVHEQQVDCVLDMVRGYVKDAKHYAQNRKPVTSLACISYAEGLLDALKYLKIADF
jgi:FAD synthetase